jgi:hypothetical protein
MEFRPDRKCKLKPVDNPRFVRLKEAVDPLTAVNGLRQVGNKS